MELKKLTPDELIECAFVDALPQDREAIEAELRRRMTPTGDVAELLDSAYDEFSGTLISNKSKPRTRFKAMILHLRNEFTALQASESGWRELVRELLKALDDAIEWGQLTSYQCIIRNIDTPAIKKAGDKCPAVAKTLTNARAVLGDTTEADDGE